MQFYLTLEEGRSVQEIAENLGISRDLLYQWRRNHKALGDIAFPGNGKPALTPDQHRIRELERQLKDTEMERDIFGLPQRRGMYNHLLTKKAYQN